MCTDSLLELYCDVDDFVSAMFSELSIDLLPEGFQEKRKPTLSDSEIMTIIIIFQTARFRNFKHFYLALQSGYKKHFTKMPSLLH